MIPTRQGISTDRSRALQTMVPFHSVRGNAHAHLFDVPQGLTYPPGTAPILSIRPSRPSWRVGGEGGSRKARASWFQSPMMLCLTVSVDILCLAQSGGAIDRVSANAPE